MTHIPLDECKDRVLYRISSRNLVYGVFKANEKGFVGIREKFGSRYLFTEYHWDTGPPFGTAHPLKELAELPADIELRESFDPIDSKTNRPVAFDKPVVNGGKGWYFRDTGESGDISPVSTWNKKLFEWLDAKEKEGEK